MQPLAAFVNEMHNEPRMHNLTAAEPALLLEGM